ncbi:MAG: hypothetical protein K6B46_03920 [Opitutales bacterium]|nr:hypothetical protein [Opitutales bacterium]
MIDPQNLREFLKIFLYLLSGIAIICFFINFKWRLPKRIFSLLAIIIIVGVCWFAFENARPNAVPAPAPAQNVPQHLPGISRTIAAPAQELSPAPLAVPVIRPDRVVATSLIYSVTCNPALIQRQILTALNAEIVDDAGNAKKFDALVIRENAIEFVFTFDPPAWTDPFKKLFITSPGGNIKFSGEIRENIVLVPAKRP